VVSESLTSQGLANLAKDLGLNISPDFGPLQLRNGPKSGDLERQSKATRLVPASLLRLKC